MASHDRVWNATRCYWMSRKSALRGVENCALGWISESEVRQLDLKEQMTARSAQSKLKEPLGWAELPHMVYKPAKGNERSNADSGVLVWEAHKFFRDAVGGAA